MALDLKNINKEKVIETLKELFSNTETKEVKDTKEVEMEETKETKETKVKMEELKGKDEVVYNVEKFEVGMVVSDSEGNPLAEGSYELEDGSKFSVDAEGKILSIEPAEEQPEEEETKTELSVDEKLAEFDLRLNKIEELLSQAMNKDDMEKTATEMKKIKEKLDKISKEPSDDEVEIKKTGWQMKQEERMSKNDKMIDSINSFRKNLRNK